MTLKLIGSFASPYVRKVTACLHLKGLDYETDPITAFFGNDEFERLSPLRRIPVLIDPGSGSGAGGDLAIPDSSAICAYLDEAWPEPPLLPTDPRDRARARWLEEYADTRLGDVFIWGLFYQKIVHPLIWGEPGDAARIEKTLAEDVPRELDWLECQLPDSGYFFGEWIGIADIAVASFFRNAIYAGVEVDPARWPRLAAFVERALAEPCFAATYAFEQAQLSTTPQRRREALEQAGARLTPETLGTREPKRGIMKL